MNMLMYVNSFVLGFVEVRTLDEIMIQTFLSYLFYFVFGWMIWRGVDDYFESKRAKRWHEEIRKDIKTLSRELREINWKIDKRD